MHSEPIGDSSITKILLIGDLYSIQADILPYLCSKEDSKQMEFYLTNLSDVMIMERDIGVIYDYIVFYIDMENEFSWIVCRKLISMLSPVACIQRCCAIINKIADTRKHAFSFQEVDIMLNEKKVCRVPFDCDNEEECINCIQSVYSIVRQSLATHVSSFSSHIRTYISPFVF